MSVFSSWAYTAKATFWRPTLDAFGQPTGYVRTVRSVDYAAGGKQSLDSAGEEFVPATSIYLESAAGDAPAPGDLVVIGESVSASPAAGYETVRTVRRWNPSTFNEGLPDYEVMTT